PDHTGRDRSRAGPPCRRARPCIRRLPVEPRRRNRRPHPCGPRIGRGLHPGQSGGVHAYQRRDPRRLRRGRRALRRDPHLERASSRIVPATLLPLGPGRGRDHRAGRERLPARARVRDGATRSRGMAGRRGARAGLNHGDRAARSGPHTRTTEANRTSGPTGTRLQQGVDPMDLRKLKTLIDLVAESNISELEITEGDGQVRIVKAPPPAPAPINYHAMPAPMMAPMAPAPGMAAAPPAAVAAPTTPAIPEGHPVLSPMVGTFYRAPQPGADPFVQVGD